MRAKFTLAARLDLSAVNRAGPEFFLDAEELVVLGNAISAARRARFDLSGIRRDRDVGNRDVFGLAGAMRNDGGVTMALRKLDGVERFGEGADLVHLNENRIGRAGIDALLEELGVRYKEV